jgi:beta-ureidopropionase
MAVNTRARIATVCQASRFYPTVEENRRHVFGLLDLALGLRPDLVCLPETFTIPSVPRQSIEEVAEEFPGPTVEAVAARAKQHRCYIVCPVVTRREGRCWNSAVVLGRTGEVVGIYDKIHPVTSTPDYTSLEQGITPGREPVVFELDFGPVGIQICFDILFQETWAELARRGARLILWPSAYNGGFPLQAYAWMHHVYVISSVNSDSARIIDPCGRVLAQTDRYSNVIYRDINLDFAVCHYDLNLSMPELIMQAYPGQVEMRSHADDAQVVVEPLDPELTIARMQDELGFITTQEYEAIHREAYQTLWAGRTLQPRLARHGNRPIHQKWLDTG